MARIHPGLIALALAQVAQHKPFKPKDDVIQEVIDGMRPSKPQLTKNQLKAIRRKNRK